MLFVVDASQLQLEWRTSLQLSGDETGISEILEGQDTHQNNQEAFKLPSRLIAKRFLFRTIFRGSGWSFANDPDFMHVSTSPQFWDGMNEMFYKKYHGLDKWHYDMKDVVMSGKPIEGPLGRSWSIDIGRDRFGELKIPWTLLSNLPVQGTGADLMMMVRIMSKKRIDKYKIPAIWRSTVHDNVVLDTESKYIKPLDEIYQDVFRDLPNAVKNTFGYEWIVPMTCESKYGPNMKDTIKC